jgi:hypothetical protein
MVEGVTYQKVIQIILETQIEQNIVVKLKKCGDLLDDLKETFDNLRKYKMKLNPKFFYSMYHQESYSTTWYQLEGSTLIQRRSKPLNNCNHPEPKEKSRS